MYLFVQTWLEKRKAREGCLQKSPRHSAQVNSMAAKLTFWKPGTTGPDSALDRATEAEGNIVQYAPSCNSSIQAQRERLPIFKHSKYIVPIHDAWPDIHVFRGQVVVLLGNIWRCHSCRSDRLWKDYP